MTDREGQERRFVAGGPTLKAQSSQLHSVTLGDYESADHLRGYLLLCAIMPL